MVQNGKFRADLYYRLNVFPIHLPPLRERQDDIPLLVQHFVRVFTERMGKQIAHIPDTVMDALRHYHWPGNIRELQNFIERSVIMNSFEVPNPAMAEPNIPRDGEPSLPGFRRSPPRSVHTSQRRCARRTGSSVDATAPPTDLDCHALL